ncbi:MAG TPA: hypothetical protein VF677_02190, partial [Flavobacterium sp.]
KFSILEAGVAAMLRGEFPNPTHMEGYLGINYRVLGGLVRGRLRFKFEVGEKCEFVGLPNPLAISVISEVSPDNQNGVDVFKKPQVAFNYAMLQPFTAEDVNGVTKTVRINVQKYELKQRGQTITGTLEWLDNNTKVNFVSDDILPPNTTIDALVEVALEQRNGNTWGMLTGGDGTGKETKAFSFTTGAAPEYIPLENIAYTYPVVDANNFYPEEHKNVYVKLKRGQDYLFDGTVANWDLKGEIKQNEVLKSNTGLTYDTTLNKITFPYNNVALNTTSHLQIIAYPEVNATSTSNPGATNATTSTTDTINSANDATTVNDVSVTNNTAEAQNNSASVKTILEYNFKTSIHPTFVSKMNSITNTGYYSQIVNADVIALQHLTTPYEIFNKSELFGSQYTNNVSLINVEAILDDPYYNNKIFPLLYEGYPKDNVAIVNRNITVFGIPPTKSIKILNDFYLYLLDNQNQNFNNTRLPYGYDQTLTYYNDFIDLRYQFVNKYLSTPINWEGYNKYRNIIEATFPSLTPGSYKINISYSLPGNEFNSNIEKIYTRN